MLPNRDPINPYIFLMEINVRFSFPACRVFQINVERFSYIFSLSEFNTMFNLQISKLFCAICFTELLKGYKYIFQM